MRRYHLFFLAQGTHYLALLLALSSLIFVGFIGVEHLLTLTSSFYANSLKEEPLLQILSNCRYYQLEPSPLFPKGGIAIRRGNQFIYSEDSFHAVYTSHYLWKGEWRLTSKPSENGIKITEKKSATDQVTLSWADESGTMQKLTKKFSPAPSPLPPNFQLLEQDLFLLLEGSPTSPTPLLAQITDSKNIWFPKADTVWQLDNSQWIQTPLNKIVVGKPYFKVVKSQWNLFEAAYYDHTALGALLIKLTPSYEKTPAPVALQKIQLHKILSLDQALCSFDGIERTVQVGQLLAYDASTKCWNAYIKGQWPSAKSQELHQRTLLVIDRVFYTGNSHRLLAHGYSPAHTCGYQISLERNLLTDTHQIELSPDLLLPPTTKKP